MPAQVGITVGIPKEIYPNERRVAATPDAVQKIRKLGLEVAEAIAAVTSTPAALLGLPDRGRVAPGARADLLLLRHRDERLLAYEIGGNPVDAVICAGQRLAA